jgi:hypothetical protein
MRLLSWNVRLILLKITEARLSLVFMLRRWMECVARYAREQEMPKSMGDGLEQPACY